MTKNLHKTGIANRVVHLVASDDPELQAFFADGLLWCYGFHHEEAQGHFSALLQKDPGNPLALWGRVYSATPFYNRPWSWYSSELKSETASLGFELLGKAQLSEQTMPGYAGMLSGALSLLYPSADVVSDQEFEGRQVQYADCMQGLALEMPTHPDIIALAAEALLNCTPWQLWDLDSGKPAPDSRVDEALALIETGLDTEQGKLHPGLWHLHIHALEMSATPQRASVSADGIRQLVNSTADQSTLIPPHLAHMASHIDVLLGDYREAIDINRVAASVDELITTEPGEFYQISRLHNLHMMLFAAMMAGRRQDAREAQLALESLCVSLYSPDNDPYLSISIEGFYANRLHAEVRFGDWQQILQSAGSTKPAGLLGSSPYVEALECYVQGVALANSGEPAQAGDQLTRLKELVNSVPEWFVINNNPAQEILQVAILMLAGEQTYHSGDYDRGLQWLSDAVDACDSLEYCEPWPWMHPPRHALGALLLEQGRTEAAKEVYETDLALNWRLARSKCNPANVWALQGLNECYRKLGEKEKAVKLEASVNQALQYADIEIRSSCFCRS